MSHREEILFISKYLISLLLTSILIESLVLVICRREYVRRALSGIENLPAVQFTYAV